MSLELIKRMMMRRPVLPLGLFSSWVMLSTFVATCGMVASVYAQVEVVEAEPEVVNESGRRITTRPNSTRAQRPGSYSTGSPASTNLSAELFVQLQTLQAEMRELRGMIEQQGYQIEQLNQRRMDDYLDLDRRLGELGAGAVSSSSRPASTSARMG